MPRNFFVLLQEQWNAGKFVCVGLDTDINRIPTSVPGGNQWEKIVNFNEKIIMATHDLVCAYKLNSAFYEAIGAPGLFALHETVQRIHRVNAEIPVIDDAKRGDIGNTNNGYIRSIFDYYGFDAVTVNPYVGAEEGIQSFLDQKDKGIIILVRTSNKGAKEIQDLYVQVDGRAQRLYEVIARKAAENWNANGNCCVVVGATYPEEFRQTRSIIGDIPVLVPGIGAQGGDLEATVKAGLNSKKQGMIINSSRGIIFASSGPDYAEAARRETQKLHDAISQVLATI